MPQSFTKIHTHLVFSTKDRKPFLDQAIRKQVHGYIATIIRNLDSSYVVVGGTSDHIHALFDIGKTRSPVDFVAQAKRESSKYIKTLGTAYQNFYWQRGYGMFSVSPTHVRQVEDYIRNQEEHHRKLTFQEEYRALMERYGIEYNEQYVWE